MLSSLKIRNAFTEAFNEIERIEELKKKLKSKVNSFLFDKILENIDDSIAHLTEKKKELNKIFDTRIQELMKGKEYIRNIREESQEINQKKDEIRANFKDFEDNNMPLREEETLEKLNEISKHLSQQTEKLYIDLPESIYLQKSIFKHVEFSKLANQLKFI